MDANENVMTIFPLLFWKVELKSIQSFFHHFMWFSLILINFLRSDTIHLVMGQWAQKTIFILKKIKHGLTIHILYISCKKWSLKLYLKKSWWNLYLETIIRIFKTSKTGITFYKVTNAEIQICLLNTLSLQTDLYIPRKP